MKPSLFTSTLAVSAIALIGTLTPPQSAIAKATNFVCGSWQGTPATLARTDKGDVPVILWTSDYFTGSGYDPQTRCQIISEKFQEYYSDGRLKYLTTGRENGMNVICAAKSNNGGCNGTLFTLKPGSDPGKTLQDLLAVRDRASGPLYESSASRVYIDIEEYLSEAATGNLRSPNSEVDSNLPPNKDSEVTSEPTW